MKKVAITILAVLSLVIMANPIFAGNPLNTDINLKVINKYIKDNPNDPNLHFVKGQLLIEKSRFRLAEKSFERVIELYPEYTEAYYELALTQYERGLYHEAVFNIDKYLETQSSDEAALVLKGRIQYAVGDLETALSLAHEVLALNEFNGDAYLLKGEVEFDLGYLESSFTSFEKSMELGVVEAGLHLKYLFEPVW